MYSDLRIFNKLVIALEINGIDIDHRLNVIFYLLNWQCKIADIKIYYFFWCVYENKYINIVYNIRLYIHKSIIRNNKVLHKYCVVYTSLL